MTELLKNGTDNLLLSYNNEMQNVKLTDMNACQVWNSLPLSSLWKFDFYFFYCFRKSYLILI